MFHCKLRPTVFLSLSTIPFFGAAALCLHGLPAAPTEPLAVAPAVPFGSSGREKSKTAKEVANANQIFGDWSNSDTKYKGQIRLSFSEHRGPIRETKAIGIRWTPPISEGANIDQMNNLRGNSGQIGGMLGQLSQPASAGIGGPNTGAGAINGGSAEMLALGAPRFATLGYAIKETTGKKTLVLKMPNQDDFEVPFHLEGATLTLNGGVFEVGGTNGRPSFLQAELNGQWKREKTVNKND